MKATLFLAAAAFLLTACSGTEDSRYYLLSAVPPSAAPNADAKAISLATVRLPGVLDRPELVVRTGAETVEILEFDRWAEPLDQMVPRILTQDLSSRLPAARPGGNEPRLHIAIDEFMTDQSGGARLTGKWWTEGQQHSFVLAATTSGSQGSQAAATLSTLLGQLADDIARQ